MGYAESSSSSALKSDTECDELAVLRDILNNIACGVGVFAIDNDEAKAVYLNDCFLKLVNISEESVKRNLPEIDFFTKVIEKDKARLINDIHICIGEKKGFSGEYRFDIPQMGSRWMNTHVSPYQSKVCTNYIAVVLADITDRKIRELELQNQTDVLKLMKEQQEFEMYHDNMTGLLNQKSYIEFLSHIEEANSIGYMCANINCLQNINYENGFDFGNRIVKGIADLLKDTFAGHNVYRINGDEFAVCCINIGREEFSERVSRIKSEAVNYGNGVSIGYAWDDFENNIRNLKKHSEELMRRGKKKYYELTNADSQYNRDSMLSQMLRQFRDNNFVVYIQPKFDMRTGKFCGGEALIRLRLNDTTVMSPDKFLPPIEKSGNISLIDYFVFEEVCKLLDRWKKMGIPLMPISFNFSRITLLESNLLKSVNRIVEKYDIPNNMLEVEITETIGDMEHDRITQIANGLHNMEFILTMDDFGTKYSSISTLSIMSVDILKLDRSMVHNLETSDIGRKVMKHIVEMCNDLGIKCVAEGVENEKQAQILTSMNCNFAQGFLYGRPVPIEDFEKAYLASLSTIAAGKYYVNLAD